MPYPIACLKSEPDSIRDALRGLDQFVGTGGPPGPNWRLQLQMILDGFANQIAIEVEKIGAWANQDQAPEQKWNLWEPVPNHPLADKALLELLEAGGGDPIVGAYTDSQGRLTAVVSDPTGGTRWAKAQDLYTGSWVGYLAGTVPTVYIKLCADQTGAGESGDTFVCALPWTDGNYPNVRAGKVFPVQKLAGAGTTYTAAPATDDFLGASKDVMKIGADVPVVPAGWQVYGVGKFLRGATTSPLETLGDPYGANTHTHTAHSDHSTAHDHTQPTHQHNFSVDQHDHPQTIHSHGVSQGYYGELGASLLVNAITPTADSAAIDTGLWPAGGNFEAATALGGNDNTSTELSAGLSHSSHGNVNNIPEYIAVWHIVRVP